MEEERLVIPELEELRGYVSDGFLTEIQVEILSDKLRGSTYEELERAYSLSGPTALSHCLRRTALCLEWFPQISTGADPYLSAPDTKKFTEFVIDACNEINCVTTSRAVHLAMDLRKRRSQCAAKLLTLANCSRLAAGIKEFVLPSPCWLHGICSRESINICRGEELEAARRIYCDYDSITRWFLEFSELFQRSPTLMFNMDETQLTTKKRLHVLCPNDRRAITTAPPVSPHITAAVTLNGAGHRIRPLIILPNKKTFRSLEPFESSAYFASSSSGWMTKNLFRFYAITFVAELSLIRLRLPKPLRDEPVLLFVDGHPSRWDFKANLIFWLFNVDVVTFPGHSSHLLQMFDVCIAAPLKAEFKKQVVSGDFSELLSSHEQATFSEYRKLNLKALRSVMIQSFLTASEKCCTTSNCRRSFAATGVAPLSPERVFESQYAMDPPSAQILRTRPSKANSKWLTSEESLAEMFYDENGRQITEADLKISLSEIYQELQSAKIEAGIPLGEPPELLSPVDRNGTCRLISVGNT